ncbi:RluA family pseudouridine synthase [Helicobacter felis]|uniref:RluA family pseudouridine synthase n=1 Tax=Helicobacter felis TaxID=214 RepID=UPI000CF06C94|nr:RluA family pseudouridine synthase [Helicobacter felis]
MQAAYKLLSAQMGISHKQAKKLIDLGRVCLGGRKLTLARQLCPLQSKFEVQNSKAQILYQDTDWLFLNKPAGVNSYALEKQHPPYKLLHRLDLPTTGVLALAQNHAHAQGLEAFKKRAVYKEYTALVQGVIKKPQTLRMPLRVQKSHIEDAKGFVKTLLDPTGRPACTKITPLKQYKNKTLLKVVITTGITHQIRAHLSALGCPIVGDVLYGDRSHQYFFLHAHRLKILDHHLQAPLPFYFEEELTP